MTDVTPSWSLVEELERRGLSIFDIEFEFTDKGLELVKLLEEIDECDYLEEFLGENYERSRRPTQ